MPFDPQKHHRRSIRLRHYDYRQSGSYFVTICTHNRSCILGELDGDNGIFLNTLGCITQGDWQTLPEIFQHVELDDFVVMPNHIHGIIVVTSDKNTGTGRRMASPLRVRRWQSGVLGAVVGTFKSMSARRINKTLGTPGANVWQRNYYERVIRNEVELNSTRAYIQNNPSKWAEDEDNPANL